MKASVHRFLVEQAVEEERKKWQHIKSDTQKIESVARYVFDYKDAMEDRGKKEIAFVLGRILEYVIHLNDTPKGVVDETPPTSNSTLDETSVLCNE